jgi:hypothetical protein
MNLLSREESDKNNDYLTSETDKIKNNELRLFYACVLSRLANYIPYQDWKNIIDREVEEFKKGK